MTLRPAMPGSSHRSNPTAALEEDEGDASQDRPFPRWSGPTLWSVIG